MLALRKPGRRRLERNPRQRSSWLLACGGDLVAGGDPSGRDAGTQEKRPSRQAPAPKRSAGAQCVAFQWNVKLTSCGLVQTFAYSMCRADTGGLIRRLSW